MSSEPRYLPVLSTAIPLYLCYLAGRLRLNVPHKSPRHTGATAVNAKTAKSLGTTLAPTLLIRVDRLIEQLTECCTPELASGVVTSWYD